MAFVGATTGPHRVYTVLDEPTAPWEPNGIDVQNPWTDALDINDYNNNYRWEPEEHNLSPGKSWEAVGPSTLLGYNSYAPADNTAAPELIISSWLQNRSSIGDVEAWMVANKSFKKWNACAIQKGVKYVYFENLPFGIHVKREINKENW